MRVIFECEFLGCYMLLPLRPHRPPSAQLRVCRWPILRQTVLLRPYAGDGLVRHAAVGDAPSRCAKGGPSVASDMALPATTPEMAPRSPLKMASPAMPPGEDGPARCAAEDGLACHAACRRWPCSLRRPLRWWFLEIECSLSPKPAASGGSLGALFLRLLLEVERFAYAMLLLCET